jgi:hypothetical protein
MAQFNNVMEIFKLLDKSNCRECNEKTCLAFAAAVFAGKKQLDQCPHLDSQTLSQHGAKTGKKISFEDDLEHKMEKLKRSIRTIDLAVAAKRLDAKYSGAKLTIKILGKDFSVDSKGNLSSDIHMHAWVVIPALNYIIHGGGTPASGKWVPFRELKNGKTWYRLFEQRCEKPLKRVADTYTDLFRDMLDIFSGRRVENHYASDIAIVLHPLPRVPILICYWYPEEDLGSNLNIFFDSTAEANLNIESIWALATGLVRMFEKIALRHGLR